MAKFQKRPVIIDAVQWFKIGDHDSVRAYEADQLNDKCKYCGCLHNLHGWIDTLEGGHIVCPGDWIITGVQGEHYPCKPDIFEQTYEVVNPVQEIKETITISRKEYDGLKEDEHRLECLEAAGVDNWEGYDVACRMMNEEE